MTENELIKAHKHASYHKKELEKSKVCGCFYCMKTFKPQEVKEWIDNKETALCAFCGIDSVIGDASGYKLDQKFLKAMSEYWFSFDNINR